jgi:hypothetical protein
MSTNGVNVGPANRSAANSGIERHERAASLPFILLLVIWALSAACASPSGRVYLRVGPPAPIVEARPVMPGAGYVWVGGYYRWDGHRHVWVPGRWERPARPRARWRPGHWVHDRHGWYFVEGQWR